VLLIIIMLYIVIVLNDDYFVYTMCHVEMTNDSMHVDRLH